MGSMFILIYQSFGLPECIYVQLCGKINTPQTDLSRPTSSNVFSSPLQAPVCLVTCCALICIFSLPLKSFN